MKRFDFKLQKLLEIRQKKEDLQKIKLAKASGEYQFELSKIGKIKNNLKDFKKSIFSDRNKISSENLRLLGFLSNKAFVAIESLKPIIEDKKNKMDKELQIYLELKKQKRVVEVLKEKQYQQYLEESAKEEQKILDDVAKDVYLKNKEMHSTSEK